MNVEPVHWLSRILSALVPLVLFSAALFVLHRELGELHYADILADLHSIGRDQILLAGFFTSLSYLALTCYDWFAIQYIGERLSYARVALASFIGYTLSHNLGFSVLTGGAARYRLLSAWGLSPLQVAQAIAFSGLVFWLGFIILAGFVLILYPPTFPIPLVLTDLSPRLIGVGLLLSAAAGVWFWCLRGQPLRIQEWEFPAPQPGLMAKSLAVAAVDWTFAAAVAYVLLPVHDLSFVEFVGIFQLSQIAGLLSHIPGGLGVFETSMLYFCSGVATKSSIIGALLIYRLVYYIVPLLCSLALFGAYEARNFVPTVLASRFFPSSLFALAGQVQARTAGIVVPFFTLGVFLSGIVLLISGATPAEEARLKLLHEALPLPAIEASHFLASIVGMWLIILARGLQRRLDAAYVLSLVVLAFGIVLSFTKGFDFEEAFFLLAVLLLLIPCRRFFYRRASLFSDPLSPVWMSSVGLVFVAAVWLIFFRYKHVEYSTSLWWEFSLLSDAPRSLRATVGAFTIALAYGISRSLSPLGATPHRPTEEELLRVDAILRTVPNSGAALALVGDKSLLFSESSRSFIMYGVEGKSWVAMGDPVGEPSEFSELIWRFCELCDQYGGQTVFYQVSAQNLQYYVETGLEFIKLGEEAHVDLRTFSLDGKTRANLRHSRNKLAKEGWSLRIIPAEQVGELLPVLRAISNAWLRHKNTREKGFSLGSFDEAYLKRLPVAVIQKSDQISAFANIWPGDGHSELSIDLMRYDETAPVGVMDFLLIELMLWGKTQGYDRFNLGMAPFSGFEENKLAPLWNKLGRMLYQHGEKYYNFQGLRHYKEKFAPEWQPRFLAVPGGLNVPRAIANIAALISGGLQGIVAK